MEKPVRFTLDQYSIPVQYDEYSRDIAPYFRKATYGVRISVGIMSVALLAAASISDKGAGPKCINEGSLPCHWKEYIRPIKLLPL